MQKSTNRFCNGKAMQIWKAFLLCFLSPVALFAQSYQSLSEKVSVNLENTTADVVVKSLEKQTPYTFTYDPEYLQHCALATVKFNNQPLSEVLHYLDAYAPLDIAFANKTVALKQGKQERVAGQDKGRVTGKIVDSKNEPLPGVTILVEGGQGMTTNVDGTYELNLEPGTYTLTFSYVSYDTKKVTEVTVKNKNTTPLDIVMKSSSSRLREVTVTGNYKRASVEGLYALQKNNAAITDGISAEQIARTPDKNMGEVLKRVSGLSTMDNKYVVVRGLSERYNQAVLNGQVMPSTELNRKNFSFDIIPSNIVENVIVVKTLTPDRSAEFGGGLVEVNTLDIPNNNFLNVSAGGSINTNTTGKDFRTLKLEGKEYFGAVSDHRKLFGKLDWKSTDDILKQYAADNKNPAKLSNNWGITSLKAQPSQNYQIAMGRVIPLKNDKQLGVVLAANYRNTLLTQDIQMHRDGFSAGADAGIDSLDGYHGKRYGFTTNLGGLVGLGYRDTRSRIGYQSLYLRALDQQLILGTGNHEDPSGMLLGYYDLTSQTTLWQNQLKGEHSLGTNGLKVKWMGSYTHLNRLRPDNHNLKDRFLQDSTLNSDEFNIVDDGTMSGLLGSGGLRWWSRAVEENYTWDASVSQPFRFNIGKVALDNTVKAGYAGWSKDRLFYVLNSASVPAALGNYPTIGEAFSSERGVDISFSKFGDDFHKTATLHAGYLMLDNKIGDKWRLVWGVRGEYINLNKSNAALDSLFSQINRDRGGNEKYDYSDIKNREANFHLFPSANLTYSLTNTMNLRLAYSESIIRPDLRELSYFREYDFELGGAYTGALVRSTTIKHFDFRYEWYPGPGEIMSVSYFHKQMAYPMEIYKQGFNREYQLSNNKEAVNDGIELEIRKSLAFTKVPVIRNLTLYGNFTALKAHVKPMVIKYNSLNPNNPLKITPVEEIKDREDRPQTGASNYMINAGAYYDIKPVSLSLTYNYVTNRMFRPSDHENYQMSLFEQPLQALDAQLAVRLFKNRAEIRINVANILNSSSIVYENKYPDDNAITNGTKAPSTKDLLYQKDKDLIDYKASPGRTWNTTLSYRF